MAIAIKAELKTNNAGTSASTSVVYPTSGNSSGNALAVGDFMLLTVAANSGATGTITTPTGWTPVNASTPTVTNSSNASGSFWQFYRFAQSGDIGATITVTSSYSNDYVVCYLQTFSGVNSTSPIAAYSIAAGGSTSAKGISPGSVTAPGAGCLPVLASMNSNNGDVAGAGIPAGYSTVDFYYPSNNLHDSYLLNGTLTTGAGTQNPTVTWEGSSSQFAMQALLTLLNPAQVLPVALQSGEYVNIANALLATNIETAAGSMPAITFQNALQLAIAVLAGIDSGAGTVSPVFYDPSGTRTRITATLDSNSNRTAVSLNFT